MVTTTGAIGLPFQEAIDYFRQKTDMPTKHWTAVMDEAHARSFMVAGAADKALVGDFRKAVDKAISQGTGLQDFRKDFDSLVEKYGWSHAGTANWRAKIIYQTNMSTAHAAGRYAQMTDPDVLKAFPYWQYQHMNCPHPRMQHLAWSGMVLRADDPFWATCYPPNGWKCHCVVLTVSERGLARMGKSGPDKSPDLKWQTYIDRTTGVVTKYPAGVDPGFAYNPGKAWKDGAKQPVRAPNVQAVGTVPPVLAQPGKTVVAPDVLQKFLEAPEDGGVQVAEMRDGPVVLTKDAVKAAHQRRLSLDAETVAKVTDGLVGARTPVKVTSEKRPAMIRADGFWATVQWNAEQKIWEILDISDAGEPGAAVGEDNDQ